MIPIKLVVRNFMCYRDQPETLDLTRHTSRLPLG